MRPKHLLSVTQIIGLGKHGFYHWIGFAVRNQDIQLNGGMVA
jgi:hypothetical protein